MDGHRNSTSKPGWRIRAFKYLWLASFLLIALGQIQEESHPEFFLASRSTAYYVALIAMGLAGAVLSVEDRCRIPQYVLMSIGVVLLLLARVVPLQRWSLLVIGGSALLSAMLLPILLSFWVYLIRAVREISEQS
jgi:hypothetical protein